MNTSSIQTVPFTHDYMPKQLHVKEFYKGKTVLVSGVTGFLGKVLLEKLIRTCECKRIYVMIRGKKGAKIQDRLQNVFNSVLFTNLFYNRPELKKYVKENVQAVQGDLISPNLGFSKEDRARLTSEVDVILSSAASVDFLEALRDILKIDYFGPVKMFQLAQECKPGVVFHHVSTAYSNSQRDNHSKIEEKVYPWRGNTDFEETIDRIMKMDPQELAKKERSILDETQSINVYVYTKHAAENYLKRHSGNVRVVISRPSMVTSTVKEPFPGWTETVSAAGIVTFPSMTGLQRNHYLNDCQVDTVPVDLVSNGILMSTAAAGLSSKPSCFVYHCTVSGGIKFNAGPDFFRPGITQYAAFNPVRNQVGNVGFRQFRNYKVYDYMKYVDTQLQLDIMERALQLPFKDNHKTLALVQKLKKARAVCHSIHDSVYRLKSFDWQFDQTMLIDLYQRMSPSDKIDFLCDPRQIDITDAGIKFASGLHRYYIKEDIPAIETGLRQILRKNQFPVAYDIRYALYKSPVQNDLKLSNLFEKVLNLSKYAQFLKMVLPVFSPSQDSTQEKSNQLSKLTLGLYQKIPQSQSAIESFSLNPQLAQQQLASLNCEVQKKAVQSLMVPLQKIMRNALEGLYVSQPGLDQVKQLMQKGDHVILVPTYKSYVDQFILLYTLFNNQIQIPFTLGNFEDTPHIPIINKILSKIGYIKAKHSRDQTIQQSYINQAVLRELILDQPLSCVYQNDTRVRSGKFSRTVIGDLSIMWILQAYLTALQNTNKNIQIVPVTINYDRVFEVRQLGIEMVSGEKPNVGMSRIAEMIKENTGGRLGRNYIIFGNAIDLRQYLGSEKFSPLTSTNLDDACLKLSQELLRKQQSASPVTLNMIVASLFMQSEEINYPIKNLISDVRKVWAYLRGLKVNTFVTLEPSAESVELVVQQLGFKIIKKTIVREQAQILQQRAAKGGKRAASAKKEQSIRVIDLEKKESDQRTMLSLTYYSNSMLQSLVNTSCFCQSLERLSDEGQSVDLNVFTERCNVMISLLDHEFFVRAQHKSNDVLIKERLDLLTNLGEIYIENGLIKQSAASNQTKFNKNKQNASFSYVTYFGGMSSYLTETYLFVILAVKEIFDQDLKVLEKKLISELHFKIQQMFQAGMVNQLGSCLIDVIKTAFVKYTQMGLIKTAIYPSEEDGVHTTWLIAQKDQDANIQKLVKILADQNQFGEQELAAAEHEISEAVANSLNSSSLQAKL